MLQRRVLFYTFFFSPADPAPEHSLDAKMHATRGGSGSNRQRTEKTTNRASLQRDLYLWHRTGRTGVALDEEPRGGSTSAVVVPLRVAALAWRNERRRGELARSLHGQHCFWSCRTHTAEASMSVFSVHCCASSSVLVS